MPRPSLKQERRAQILDAYERCLIRFGVEGSSLEAVAKEAGLARALIRHNVGNRDQLLEAAVDRFLEQSRTSMEQLVAALPAERPLVSLIDWLFDPQGSDPHLSLVSDALIAASANDPALARRMRDWTRAFVDSITEVARKSHPGAEEAEVGAVAAGITATYFTAEALTPMGPMSELRVAFKTAALRLVQTLD